MSKIPSKPPTTIGIFFAVILEFLLFVACYYALGPFDMSEETRGTISAIVFVALPLLAILIGTIIWTFRRRKQKPPSRARKRRRKVTAGKKKRARE